MQKPEAKNPNPKGKELELEGILTSSLPGKEDNEQLCKLKSGIFIFEPMRGRFELTDAHPFPVFIRNNQNDENDFIKVCDVRLTVTSQFKDLDDCDTGKVVMWTDLHSGVRKTEYIDDEDLYGGENAKIRKKLARAGIKPDPRMGNNKDYLIGYLQACNPNDWMVMAKRTGWFKYKGKFAYVQPDSVVGLDTDRIVFRNATRKAQDTESIGTLKEWQTFVGIPALTSSRTVLAVCAFLAGPLIRILRGHRNNAGFHLLGDTSKGKSLVLKIGASVVGDPEACANSWDATICGVSAVAMEHNDGTLLLDEFQQLSNKAEAGRAIYNINNGCERIRMDSKTDTSKGTRRWNVIVVSSGETGLRDLVCSGEKGKIDVPTGAQLRFLEVPADAGYGLGANETLPEGCADTLDYKAKMSSAIARYHGTAGKEWLKRLVEAFNSQGGDDGPLGERAQEWINEYARKVAGDEHSNNEIRQGACSFGLLALAGELASGGFDGLITKESITGWKPSVGKREGDAVRLITKCFYAWRRNFGDGRTNKEKNLIENTKIYLSENLSNFLPLKVPVTRTNLSIKGFKGWSETGRNQEFLVHLLPEHFERDIVKGANSRAVAEILHNAGILIKPKGRWKRQVYAVFPAGDGNSKETVTKRVWVYTLMAFVNEEGKDDE